MNNFRRQMNYKTRWNGVEMVLAPCFYPSSKRCSSCENIIEKLALGERTYLCPICDLEIDRDLNAVLNLKAWYMSKYTASSAGCGRGEDVRPKATCSLRQTSKKRQPDWKSTS